MSASVLKFVLVAELPNRIRELRKAKGWTLERLAEGAGTNISMLSELERGQRELSLTWMKRIAAALKCEPVELLCPTDNSYALSPEERRHVDRLRRAGPEQRDQVYRMAEILIPDEARADAA